LFGKITVACVTRDDLSPPTLSIPLDFRCLARASLAKRRRAMVDLTATFIRMTVSTAMNAVKTVVAEREWEQFHSEGNLAKSVAIEAGELLQCFQWGSDFDADRVQDELADVLTYCLLLADKLGVDPEQIVMQKLAITRKKYPVDKARGRSAKYDAL
jgi:dCTP diphosphatase